MTVSTEAWVLYAAPAGVVGPAQLERETYEFADIADNEVLCESLYGCWEGNMGHAVARSPIDICKLRGEEKVVIGNTGVVRVLKTGHDVSTVQPGQNAMVFPAAVTDRHGYPEKIMGYDAPGTMGVLARRMKTKAWELIPLPENSRYSLAQWAAFSGRYVTAWSNWELASGTFRLLVGPEENPHPSVWGWGGGTALAELELAQRQGCRAVMLSGNDRRIAEIERAAIKALDRRKFGDLTFDERRFSTDRTARRKYLDAETAFLKEVQALTEGQGVNIFVDHIGTAVLRATMKALSREGVIATAGWKEGQVISFLRAVECIERHQHVHTHYARYRQGVEAMAYAERHGWMPRIDARIYGFDEIPALAESFLRGDHELFPVFSVNP
jgi:NADPH:quinone reductase-like Zn-dependent oxidoreductase